MTEIFLCRKDQLAPRARTDLRKAGVVVVEVDDPSACQLVRAGEVLSSSDMLWATLDALCLRPQQYGSDGVKQREQLAANLLRLVVESRQQKSLEATA